MARINTADELPAFRSTAGITIPASGTSGVSGPYPPQISLSGLHGNVTDLRVQLTGFFHTYPGDVDFLLVGPTGASTLLSSDDVSQRRPVAAGVTMTFSDVAPSPLPTTSLKAPLVSGTFRPTNSGPTIFPAPAPAAPYGSQLAGFDGTDPNGAWSLYVHDQSSGDVGYLTGWGLNIGTTGPPPGDALTLTLRAAKKQRAKKLKVLATCSVACDLSAGARGRAGGERFKTKESTGGAEAGEAEKLKLEIPKTSLREIEGASGKAKIEVSATASGATVTKAVKVRLK